LPAFKDGWKAVLDSLQKGKFFSTTGEVLIPAFSLKAGKAVFDVEWTFPLEFAELVSGDGEKVYRQKLSLNTTGPFGRRTFTMPFDPTHRKWVRLEVWDAAVNGAFTQTITLP